MPPAMIIVRAQMPGKTSTSMRLIIPVHMPARKSKLSGNWLSRELILPALQLGLRPSLKYKTNKQVMESNFLSAFQPLNLKRWRSGCIAN